MDEFIKYLKSAMENVQNNNPGQGFFYLGAAAHLVQDMCVPHHSRNMVLAGHLQYEKWVEKHAENYLVDSDGAYEEGPVSFKSWAIENATTSYDWFAAVKTTSNRGYHLVTSILLPQAQRSTAGFFQHFIQRVFLAHSESIKGTF